MLRFAFAALFLLTLAACWKSRPRADLVFINGAEPESIDPAVVIDQVGMRVASALFEGLCRIDEAGKPQPGMAERWDVSPDRKVYTFHLRPNTMWSDSVPLTTHDFVYSWRRVLDPGTGADYASQFHVIKNAQAFHEGRLTDFTQVGVTAPDDRTLRVELENPTPYFLDLCAFTTFAPVPGRVIAKHGSMWIKPGVLIGNGSYVLEDWLLDDRIVLRRNERYWDAANVPLRTIEVLPISEPNTAINYFLTGQADLIMDKGMVPTSLTAKLKQQPYFHTGPFLGSFFTRFNVRRAPFDDPKIRLAFSLAVDRNRVTGKITQLGERAAFSLTPPGAGQNYQPPPGPGFDPKRAQQLLAEAGYPGGKGFPRVEYLYFPKLLERNIAVELQAMWQEHLGVSVDLVKQEWKTYLASMRETNYDLCRSSWVGDYNDPGTFLEMFLSASGNNCTGWANAKFDGFIAAAAREPDLNRRNTIFQQAEKLLVTDDCVILPIYHYVGVQFYHADKLTGVRPNMIDDHPFRCMRWK
ncbi:MAG: peptide ABC transporter substrate-binding protein [Verrucomicrobiaceae bacterium]|nr:peptide ABC transporter substrate-binding protein [Verrucomicrobiaceae bacterium]